MILNFATSGLQNGTSLKRAGGQLHRRLAIPSSRRNCHIKRNLQSSIGTTVEVQISGLVSLSDW